MVIAAVCLVSKRDCFEKDYGTMQPRLADCWYPSSWHPRPPQTDDLRGLEPVHFQHASVHVHGQGLTAVMNSFLEEGQTRLTPKATQDTI